MITARPLFTDGQPTLALRAEHITDVYCLRAWVKELGTGWTIEDPQAQLSGDVDLPWTVNLVLRTNENGEHHVIEDQKSDRLDPPTGGVGGCVSP